jgi:hypothetical protein
MVSKEELICMMLNTAGWKCVCVCVSVCVRCGWSVGRLVGTSYQLLWPVSHTFSWTLWRTWHRSMTPDRNGYTQTHTHTNTHKHAYKYEYEYECWYTQSRSGQTNSNGKRLVVNVNMNHHFDQTHSKPKPHTHTHTHTFIQTWHFLSHTNSLHFLFTFL